MKRKKKAAKKTKKSTAFEALTTEQLAERWQMNPGSLKNWRYQGKGPKYVKFGRQVNGKDIIRYRLEDIMEFEAVNEVVPKRVS